MNQNDNEINASWDGVKLFLTEKFKSDMVQFAGERDSNKAQEFRDNIRKILEFIRTVKDARKRANASAMPVDNTQPFSFQDNGQPSVNQSNPLGIQPSVNQSNPLGTSDKPLNAGIQQKKPDEPSVFSGLKNLFGGKARTLRHRAYYNNTLRNFR